MRATLCNDEDDMTPGCQIIKTTLVTLKVDYLSRNKPIHAPVDLKEMINVKID